MQEMIMPVLEAPPTARNQDHRRSKPSRIKRTAAAAVAVLSLAAVAAGVYAIQGNSAAGAGLIGSSNLSARTPASAMPTFADLVDDVRQSVVSVRVVAEVGAGVAADEEPNAQRGMPFGKFFRGSPGKRRGNVPLQVPKEARRYGEALGSGFLIAPDGYIVTNGHVVDNAVSIEVVMDDGTVIPAKVVGTDPTTDLALLKIDHGSNLSHVMFADAVPRVGEWVVAMGNPYGLGGTATAGIISAKGRDIGMGPIDDYIQIDAPVNRGNSGGPTFNLSGQVIGVNTAIYSPSGGSIGIAFDIPASTVKTVVYELKERGRVERGWLGVVTQPVTPEIAQVLGMKDAAGALVAGIQPASPAAKAGLAVGDVIAELDGMTIKEDRDLARHVVVMKPGRTVNLSVLRKGRAETVAIKLEPLRDANASPSADREPR
jgi:serine protease Do